VDYCLAGDDGAAASWNGEPDLDLDGDGRLDAIELDFDGDGIVFLPVCGLTGRRLPQCFTSVVAPHRPEETKSV